MGRLKSTCPLCTRYHSCGTILVAPAGLQANTYYTYTLDITSGNDVSTVTGEFTTGDPSDTTPAGFTQLRMSPRDSESIVFVYRPNEDIHLMDVIVTNQTTSEVKIYRFFGLKVGEAAELLLDGLEANQSYSVRWSTVDLSGNYVAPNINFGTSTGSATDSVPPVVETREVLERTDTTAKVKVTTDELIRKLKVQYRIPGTEEWQEVVVEDSLDLFEVDLSGLLPGVEYEYRFILEDLTGNVLVTDLQTLV